MIPISKDKRLEWEDESGVVYVFKPLVGETEVIANEVWEGWKSIGKDDTRKISELADRLINAVLVDWKKKDGANIELPEFPKDGKPADMFTIIDKTSLLLAIQRVNSLSEVDKKN